VHAVVVELGTASDLEGMDGDSEATLSSPLSYMFKTFKGGMVNVLFYKKNVLLASVLSCFCVMVTINSKWVKLRVHQKGRASQLQLENFETALRSRVSRRPIDVLVLSG
jgi:hypothetical protein